MTTKPEGPVQEPEAVCCFNCPYMVTPGHVCTNCGKFNPLPATPAPSQPAGARELAIDILSNCAGKYVEPRGLSRPPQQVINEQIDYATTRIAEYARQQTAAKDADEPTPQEIIAAYDRAIKDKEAAERERNSLREALNMILLLADTNNSVRHLARSALKAGKDGRCI